MNAVRLILLFFIITIIITEISAENKNNLKFNKQLHNFGKVNQRKKIKTIFYCTNKTKKNIKIKKVHSTCGCTVPYISRKNLKPDEWSQINIVFNTGQYRGNITHKLYLETIPKISPPPSFIIKAYIIQDVYLEPDNIFISQSIHKKFIQKNIKILSEKYKNFQLNDIKYNKKYMKITSKKYKDKKNNLNGYSLLILIYPGKIKDKFIDEKVIIQTSIKSSNPLSLHIYGYVH